MKCLRDASSSGNVSDFFVKVNSDLGNNVSAAEGALAFHTVAHHHSFSSMDCTPALLRKIFPDSKIASKLSAGRTKTIAIVKSVLAPHSLETLTSSLTDIAFVGVSTDSSNHGSIKMFPILVHYFDHKNGGLQIKLCNIECKGNEKADTIAAYVGDTLDAFNIRQKCVAFGADNCNTMFGGIARGGGNNVFSSLKRTVNDTLVGTGCPAHILNNCIQHGVDVLEVDLQALIVKIYNYFSIYTVRVESLKEFCEFVDIEYQQLLSHCQTRWLSLFPAVQRLLLMFPALKSFFLSQSKPPAVLKKFFEDPFSEIYLLHVQSLVATFHSYIRKLEAEDNSIIDALKILSTLRSLLEERNNAKFTPLKVKDMLHELESDGYLSEINRFWHDVQAVYESCLEYLDMWIQPFKEFSVFGWLDFEDMSWDAVESCIQYLEKKGVKIDDSKCFDQFSNLKAFVAKYEEKSQAIHKKWCDYINWCKSAEQYEELLKIVQFFFSIPAHNAAVERLFSLINAQWTKERNRLCIDSIKAIALVKFNFRNYTCATFYDYLTKNALLLKKISSGDKYTGSQGLEPLSPPP